MPLSTTDQERLLNISPSADDAPRTPAELNHYPMPAWKRAFDIIGSLTIILALSPVLIAVALYVKIVSGGPITFRQQRLGEMGKYFTIYKFRTLESAPNATSDHRDYVSSLQESDAILEKPDFGDRLIPGGGFLRGHALDELPQLFNVLFGTMSLVGPRPEVLHWEDYPPRQRRRFEATPGMTGLWQVSGKNHLSFAEMIDLDIEYIHKRSLRLDLEILFRTFRVVIRGDE